MSPKDLEIYKKRNFSVNEFSKIFSDMLNTLDDAFYDNTNGFSKVVDNKDGTTAIKFNLSGFSKEDIELSEKNGTLSVKASKSLKDKKTFHDSSYHESFYIGDSEILGAEMNNGLLEVTIKKKDDTSRSIEIK